ncbi:MAG: hypothetical protein HY901_26000, partial [Deltaproteobacteria bacterium]|nr:hypothetical protein [Deltaproteobacteria bacterium]
MLRSLWHVWMAVLIGLGVLASMPACTRTEPLFCVRTDDCPQGFWCQAGRCIEGNPPVACSQGLTECNGLCVDTAHDPLNCGTCGKSCPGTQVCASGTCLASCPSGEAECSRSCVDLASDPKNCGECGLACASGQSCAAGR